MRKHSRRSQSSVGRIPGVRRREICFRTSGPPRASFPVVIAVAARSGRAQLEAHRTGVPTYMALFGRDMLTAGWQASLLSNDMGRGPWSLLAKTQTFETNDWRDAQPGRMLHESHTDPLSALNFTPEGLYFGTANVPFLYPIVVSELWHWTGNKDELRQYAKPALDTLALGR